MSTVNAFCQFLGIRYPIVQAPMAGVSTPALAAAVSNAGGLGSLGIGASTARQAREMIAATRALTDKPFNVNVFCHAPAQRDAATEAAWIKHMAPLFAEVGTEPPRALDEIYKSFLEDDEAFEMLLVERPAVISFHFGLPPADRIDALRRAGIRTMATATSLHEAELIQRAGMDIVVAQGMEAGGHRGVFDPAAVDEQLSMPVLVRLLRQKIRLPIVAAGGIMDGAGIKAALAIGAVGVQLGTAFVPCPESSASADYRANLKGERAATTQLTAAVSGRVARGMVNRLFTHGSTAGAAVIPAYPVTYDVTKRLNAAASARGVQDFAVQWAGQGAPLSREMPATELMATLVGEWGGA